MRQGKNINRLERPWILVRPIDNAETTPFRTEQGQWLHPDEGFDIRTGNTVTAPTLFTKEELADGGFIVWLGYTVKNYGRSPGHMVYHWANIAMRDEEGAMPKRRIYSRIYKGESPSFNMPDTRLMEPRNSFRNYVRVPLRDFIAMWEGQKFMYLYGYIDYRDVWGKKHRTGFGFHYHIGGAPGDVHPRGFFPEPQSYNYET